MDRESKRRRTVYDLDTLFQEDIHDNIHSTLSRTLNPKQNTTSTVSDSVRSQFQDRLKLLIKHADRVGASSSTMPQPTSFLKALSITGAPQLVPYSKLYEESMMRPANKSESSCDNQTQCECLLINTSHPLNGEMDHGNEFIGVAFPGYSQCLLCLRRDITQSYFHHLTLSSHVSVPLHSYYNLVQTGEYNAESCLWPSNANGITDPIVFHSRSNYYYHNGCIKQHSNVNFRLASS